MAFRRGPTSPEEAAEAREKARQRKRARDKRKALARLRAVEEAGADLSGWESEFVSSLGDRLETYDAAFRNRDKGAPDAALSYRQQAKLKEVAAKAKKAAEDAAVEGSDRDAAGGSPRLRVVGEES